MAANVPSEEEVLGYFKSLSNWGRWGEEDQLGTLNFLSPKKTLQAASLVKEGVTVSCARTITWESAPDIPNPPIHFMVESGEGWASGDKVTSRPSQASTDFFGLIFHGYAITHIDSLAHFFWEGKMYNGRPAHLVSTNQGATVESVELAKNGIITRGVLVDVPMIRGVDWLERGEGVMPEDILAAEERCGFRVEEGDVLLVRTGQLHRRNVEGPVNPSRGRLHRVSSGLFTPISRARHRGNRQRHRQRRDADRLSKPVQSNPSGRHHRHGTMDSRQCKP